MMLREIETNQIQLCLSLTQAKKIYIALFHRLHDSRLAALDDLDDDDMLLTLQTYLQRRARAAGVDCTDHAAWEAFLGMSDMPSCETRFADRQPGP